MTRLTPQAYRDHVQADVHRVVELLADASWTAPVPGCPHWDLEQLVRHLGRVHRMVAARIEGAEAPAEQPLAADLPDWLAEGGARLVAALDGPPEREVWTFEPTDQTLGFWQRRQAMENLVHRIDAEEALTSPSPVDPALAADGVAEVVDVMVRLRVAEGDLVLPPHTIELHATDTGNRWTIGEGETVGCAEAPAEVLLRRLWHRPSGDEVHVTGHTDEVLAHLKLPLVP